MGENDSVFIPNNRYTPGRPGKRRGTLTEWQGHAIIWKVEEGLSTAEITRRLNSQGHKISAQAVSRWWTRPHVKRELKRQRENFDEELMPALVADYNKVQQESIKQLLVRSQDPRQRTSDIIALAKLAREVVKGFADEVAEEDENFDAKRASDAAWEALTPKGREKLARAMAFGDQIDIEDDDLVEEAEVVEDEPIPTAITTGDNKETSS